MSQTRNAAIAGIHEYPLRVAPGVSAMQIKAASLKAALDDAGLKWSDVDGLYDAGDGAKSVAVKVRDLAGNTSVQVVAATSLDAVVAHVTGQEVR